jgi:hypothetical protein
MPCLLSAMLLLLLLLHKFDDLTVRNLRNLQAASVCTEKSITLLRETFPV